MYWSEDVLKFTTSYRLGLNMQQKKLSNSFTQTNVTLTKMYIE